MFKLKIEKKAGGRAMFEKTPRYAVTVNGVEVSELSYNKTNYTGYLMDIYGRTVDIRERGISAFETEMRRINREAKAVIKAMADDTSSLSGINPTVDGRTVQLTFTSPEGQAEEIYVERSLLRAGLELFGREGLKKAYFDEFREPKAVLKPGGTNVPFNPERDEAVLAAMPTETHGIYAVVVGNLPASARDEALNPFSNAYRLTAQMPSAIARDAARIIFVDTTVPGTPSIRGNLPARALPENGSFNERLKIFAPLVRFSSDLPAILMDPTEEKAFGDYARSIHRKVLPYPAPEVSDTIPQLGTGGSLRADDIANLKVGDVIYECGSGHNMEVMILSAPVTTDGEQFSWEAVDTTTGGRVSYSWSASLSCYGPRIYDAPQYACMKDDEKTGERSFVYPLVGGRELRVETPEAKNAPALETSKPSPFKIAENEERICEVLAVLPRPEGVVVRPICYAKDYDVLRKLETIKNADISRNLEATDENLPPYFGVSSENEEDALTLIAEMNGEIVGQISCVVTPEEESSDLEVNLWVDGVYVVPEKRGIGIGHCLGAAAMEVTRDHFRRAAEKAGLPFDDGIYPDAHVVEGEASAAILHNMCMYRYTPSKKVEDQESDFLL